jgi:hypothetical protein
MIIPWSAADASKKWKKIQLQGSSWIKEISLTVSVRVVYFER